MDFIIIDERLERAIDNTDMGNLRKNLYKKILGLVDGKLQVSKLAVELLLGFVKSEDIRKIKNELKGELK